MAASDLLTTVVSTKGQVILPKVVRESRRWNAGTRLVVEDTPEGVLLRPALAFPPTRLDEVVGILHASGPARTVEEMDAAILREAAQRHGRD
ncbi:AbrB/MazE/SpoVT family DNA-binding domain-containing protein [Rubellimicrobium aerolatum]|uniref:AbrB/MazE/SpoVT family DNA-binding domain-containing protein n=1 Tax=Rubellimicrobium aerolatum TaxID=490979 RepID=A0ABW0SHL1_9RHOB|nr:AbrB/MazE/SpoVT family DNA-binding domain-containing protein [Rubellimicrobium aerolatum]MBP1807659.1 AbrB family looped-hinge helix DNA binding protein [Rubellimicrobium aerolatum]